MRNNNGFTLLELSAVLIVLGLVVGGILVGQNLWQAAKMRGVFTQYSLVRCVATGRVLRKRLDCRVSPVLPTGRFSASPLEAKHRFMRMSPGLLNPGLRQYRVSS